MNDPRERIAHLCLACFYIDGHTYQENLIPKFHRRAGHDVSIIASLVTFDRQGRLDELDGPSEYVNEHGISVRRLAYSRLPFSRKLRHYVGLQRALDQSHPTVLFIHGPQFIDALVVARFLRKHPETRAYVDSHADFGNSATGFLSRHVLHGLLWRATTGILARRARQVYGVTPARVDFLRDVYRLPPDKTELLILGADDDLITAVNQQSRAELRAKHGLPQDAFLVATGGKVNEHRPEVLNLMKAATREDSNFGVVVFGNASPDYEQRYAELSAANSVHALGWLNPQASLEVFAASDVVCFPGKHSVLWEQAVALGLPLIARHVEGAQHIDLGGNCLFIHEGSEQELFDVISGLTSDTHQLDAMREAAQGPRKEGFLYGRISSSAIHTDGTEAHR